MAKCPKCHEAVRIPGGSSPSSPANGPDGAPPIPAGHIVFKCPNGHRLNGPASLQGKAGQCPHCGAKFRIPSAEEESAAAPPADDELSADPAEHDAPELEMEELGEDEQFEELSGEEYYDEHAEGEPSVDFGLEDVEPANSSGAAASATGWGALFLDLWQERSTGSEVDLYLADGTKLTPKWFSKSHSQEEQGVFAVRDTEGAYTLMAIAWDSVIRVDVRGVIDLPESMFEE